MEFVLVLRELGARRLLVAPGLVLAVIAAVFSVYRLDGFKLKPRSLQKSAATTQVFVDTPTTVLGDVTQAIPPLLARATVYANFMASPSMLQLIGQKVGIAGDRISAAGPIDPSQPRTVTEPTALKRNVELTGETNPYQFEFSNDPNLPLMGVYAQAPTTALAIALANAAASSLASYVGNLQAANHVAPRSRVVIRQLGSANGAVVNGGISKVLFGMVFVAIACVWCALVLVGARFRRIWRESRLHGVVDLPAYERAERAAQPLPAATETDAQHEALPTLARSVAPSGHSTPEERLPREAPDERRAQLNGPHESQAETNGLATTAPNPRSNRSLRGRFIRVPRTPS